MERSASAYLRNGLIYLHSLSKTVNGVWVLSKPVIKVDFLNDTGRLSQAVNEVLEGSDTGIAHPTSWSGLFDPVLKISGVKSKKTFYKGAKVVLIDSSDLIDINFTPTKFSNSSEGFQPIEDKKLKASGEMGETLVKCFEFCE
jgi:hypothetical protein